MLSNNICWPVLLHPDGMDELIYVDNMIELQNEFNSSTIRCVPEDRLIDSQGRLFNLQCDVVSGQLNIISMQQTLNLESFSILVRRHFSAMNQCCISKINLVSFDQGIQLVKSTD